MSFARKTYNRWPVVINPLTWDLEMAFAYEWPLPGGGALDRHPTQAVETFSWVSG
jgi:hypothetical protein